MLNIPNSWFTDQGKQGMQFKTVNTLKNSNIVIRPARENDGYEILTREEWDNEKKMEDMELGKNHKLFTQDLKKTRLNNY